MDLCVSRHVGAPLRRILADEVVRLSPLFLEAAHHRLACGAHEVHAQCDRFYGRLCVGFRIRLAFRQHQHGFASGEIEAVAGTARKEMDVLVALAAIRFEVKGSFP